MARWKNKEKENNEELKMVEKVERRLIRFRWFRRFRRFRKFRRLRGFKRFRFVNSFRARRAT